MKAFFRKPLIIPYSEIKEIKTRWSPYGLYYYVKSESKKICLQYPDGKNEKIIEYIEKFKKEN